MTALLDRETILELLRELGRRLGARGMVAEIYVVGGTAMVLAYDRTRLTHDVDAIAADQEAVEAEARLMARGRRDIRSDWFNGRVRSLLPLVSDPESVEAFAAPGISVSVASPRHMLAMKIRAARGERDIEDIVLLCELLEISSVAEALAIADDVWGPGMIREENRFLVSTALRDRGFG